MKPESSKPIVNTNVPDLKFWDNQDDLEIKEKVLQRQNEIETTMKEKTRQFEPAVAQLFRGMVEIADVILKNTSGVGSNFKLAECELTLMSSERIQQFYDHVMSVLSYQFGQLIPDDGETIWQALQSILEEPSRSEDWKRKLSTCLDHETGLFSPVRAGRMLWEEVAQLFGVKQWDKNTTARIYYQTAPGQDLIYVIESIGNERWSSKP